MKKQNVNSKLAFNKVAIVELNDSQLQNINGGSDPAGVSIAVSVAVITIAYEVGVEIGHWISKAIKD